MRLTFSISSRYCSFPSPLLLCLLLYTSLTECYPANHNQQKLLLISLDGFRHDYLELAKSHGTNTSGFRKIWANGIRAMRVRNEFITKTAPNHYSLVTGLHEESHGIVANVFFDPKLKATFHMSSAEQANQSQWFDVGGEPIWITNERHGYRSGVANWFGGQAAINGRKPSQSYPKFDIHIPFRKSIDNVLNWFHNDGISMAALYYHQPDYQGHMTGPHSPEVMRIIGNINDDIEYLLERISQSILLHETLNLIITSDHGMTEISPRRVVVLSDYLRDDMYFSPGDTVRCIWSLWPSEAEGGDHGYDPANSDMSPFFLAMGPGFRKSNASFPTIDLLHMLDIYPMMCHLLGLQDPHPHNGSFERISHLLLEKTWPTSPTDTFIVTAVFPMAILLVLMLCGIAYFIHPRSYPSSWNCDNATNSTAESEHDTKINPPHFTQAC